MAKCNKYFYSLFQGITLAFEENPAPAKNFCFPMFLFLFTFCKRSSVIGLKVETVLGSGVVVVEYY